MLKILPYPHKNLKKTLLPTTVFDDELRQQISQMFELMYAVNGWGLAASQVGLSFRGFVMDISPNQKSPYCIINPEIVTQEGEVQSQEDCLSLPGLYIDVVRSKKIEIQYQDQHGEHQSLSATDLMSCCIQHGIDHLNGILIIDHLSKLKRERTLKKYLKDRNHSHACHDHHCHHDHA